MKEYFVVCLHISNPISSVRRFQMTNLAKRIILSSTKGILFIDIRIQGGRMGAFAAHISKQKSLVLTTYREQ